MFRLMYFVQQNDIINAINWGAQAMFIVLALPLVWYWHEYVLIKNRHLICYLLMNRSNIFPSRCFLLVQLITYADS
ncbi:hypothetical protein BGI32_04420 [Snodgrassella alvi]|uniref:Uncharacterized protein n=1 Tax=Snodgrassella alvi TaxID=1196083 RepID=A0A2N9WUZ5_9NEIS|nr:hypothetical protein BGI32_04420 [Snodgrassella alvi]